MASTSALPPPLLDDDLDDIEKILNSEASLLTRENEVMRIVKAFKLNPYEILDLDMMPGNGLTDTDIHKVYRKKSLLIHPDKLKHERGIEAFDLLKKAETEILEPAKRKLLDETILDARMLVLRAYKLPSSTPNDSPELLTALRNDKESDGKSLSLEERVRRKTKEILIDDELRRRRVTKMTMIAEGAEAKRVEEAAEKRKRKMEEDKKWEDTREDRVSDWRSFTKGTNKKKKQKVQVLG
ncbi:hypothetical protein MNV49_001159 [Pseudohyphozyma bogoriensis]|nr:hypothetical protein MNV49_001159 [Pseudohyphozyma bogoriensis]